MSKKIGQNLNKDHLGHQENKACKALQGRQVKRVHPDLTAVKDKPENLETLDRKDNRDHKENEDQGDLTEIKALKAQYRMALLLFLI